MENPIEFGIGRGAFKSSGRAARRRLAIAAIWAGLVTASLCCQGCVVLPIRTPTRTNGNSGAMKSINFGFIEAGKTTREEVTQQLGSADTGVDDKRLFLGRWATSKWGVLWMFASQYSATGGFNRSWARHNVLIVFDDDDVVKQYRQFPDEELVSQLSACVAQGQAQPLDLSAPIEVSVEHRHSSGLDFTGEFVLGTDSLTFREQGGVGKHDFQISPERIKELRLTEFGHGDKSDPRFMNQTIRFTEKTKVGGRMTIRVDIPTVLVLVKCLSQTRSTQSPPERNPRGIKSCMSSDKKAFDFRSRSLSANAAEDAP
jgi:hypothetical protein